MADRMFEVHLRSDFIFNLTKRGKRQKELLKILHGFTDSVIISRREELMKKGGKSEENDDTDDVGVRKKMAFLDVLLQSTIEGKPLNNMDIREEVDTFMFEGHDTTSSGIAFCLYNLAKHPEVQQKAFEEIRQVFGDDLERATTLKDLNDLHYLENVIKESLRLYPSVPFYARKISENVDIRKD
jgi:cytochrome P450 family 4